MNVLDAMPLHPGAGDIALRLLLALAAGGLIGANREARGEKAGLRTNMLVALAAAVAMVQANLLLPAAGRTDASFSVMDVMRLPLGILSGMGFIGAGAILRRGELVIGVTTAATLWMVTVIGLCFGGGQFLLGGLATALAVAIVFLMRKLDDRISHVRRATLRVSAARAEGSRALVEGTMPPAFRLTLMDVAAGANGACLLYEVKWNDVGRGKTPDAVLADLGGQPGVTGVTWRAMTKRG
jgi:putative Mg2+ transporter-C (MgtC) family protein